MIIGLGPIVASLSSMVENREGANVRVMIIDDHEIVRRGISDIIDRADGLEVVAEAGSKAEAIRRADLMRPDVVLEIGRAHV